MSFTMASPYAEKHRVRWVLVWLCVLVLIIGGAIMGRRIQTRHEMVRIAHSPKVSYEVKESPHQTDPDALTP